MVVHSTTSSCPFLSRSPLLSMPGSGPRHYPCLPRLLIPRSSSLHPVPPRLQLLCPPSPTLTHASSRHPAGMSLDVYNQLRGQLRELLAEGGAGPEHQARLERVRAALFTSLVVAFPVAGGQQEHAFEDEAETEDDILCYVD